MASTALHRAAESMGGQSSLAKAIGTSQQSVWNWMNGRVIPAEHCASIERVTSGSVTCEDLRDDIAWVRIPDKDWPWHKKGRPVVDVTKAA